MFSQDYSQLQDFQYFVVIDFEATCDKGKNKFYPQEIIEFPSVLVNVVTGELQAYFQTYVKPIYHPKLTDFCKELTGIQQVQVDNGLLLREALELHDKSLQDMGIKDSKFAVVTWSNWDCGVMLENECKLKWIEKPDYFNRWINLRVPFSEVFGSRCKLKEAVEMAGLVWEGRQHCGLDDAINTACLLVQLMKRGYKFSITNSLMPSTQKSLTNSLMPSTQKQQQFAITNSLMPSTQKSITNSLMSTHKQQQFAITNSLMPSTQKSLTSSLMPSTQKSITNSLMSTHKQQQFAITNSLMPSTQKSLTSSLMPSTQKSITNSLMSTHKQQQFAITNPLMPSTQKELKQQKQQKKQQFAIKNSLMPPSTQKQQFAITNSLVSKQKQQKQQKQHSLPDYQHYFPMQQHQQLPLDYQHYYLQQQCPPDYQVYHPSLLDCDLTSINMAYVEQLKNGQDCFNKSPVLFIPCCFYPNGTSVYLVD